MKNKFFLVLLLASLQLSFSQFKKKYTIYLNFDSSKEQMITSEKKMSDSIWVKTFNFPKDVLTENCKSALTIDSTGRLIKQIDRGNTEKKEDKIVLYHYSYRNKIVSLDQLPQSNIIEYDDFINSEFISFSKVLKNAENVYVIDSGESRDSSDSIKAYQVVF